jgi:hypothetical protein
VQFGEAEGLLSLHCSGHKLGVGHADTACSAVRPEIACIKAAKLRGLPEHLLQQQQQLQPWIIHTAFKHIGVFKDENVSNDQCTLTQHSTAQHSAFCCSVECASGQGR